MSGEINNDIKREKKKKKKKKHIFQSLKYSKKKLVFCNRIINSTTPTNQNYFINIYYYLLFKCIV